MNKIWGCILNFNFKRGTIFGEEVKKLSMCLYSQSEFNTNSTKAVTNV